MGDAGGIREARKGRLGEAEGGFGGERSDFGGGNSQPSPGKNISNQGRSIPIPDGVELSIALFVT
jgi:hypothetical protein